MRPWLSSFAATRSMVADGMTSTRRRGPNTVMPIARPAASKARPPSALRRKRRSSSIRASISPPRKDRQGPAERDTTPSAAVGAPSSAPTAMASAPTADGCCLKRDWPQVGTVNPQQRDIGGGIASDELRRDRVAAGKRDGELAVLGQGFIGSDDEPWPPDEAARTRAVRVDSDDAGRVLATKLASAVDRSCIWANAALSVIGGLR